MANGFSQTVPNRKPRLSDEAIGVAILWLESNEGDEGEMLQTVADWLKVELNHRFVRDAARRNNCTAALVRTAISKATT